MKKILAILASACVLTATPAFAQLDKLNSLTSNTIGQFIASMTDKTKPGGRLKDDGVREYLNAHLSDTGIYKSTILYNIPGQQPVPKQIEVGKAQFIENVIGGRNAVQDYSSSVTLSNIVIASDRKSATLNVITQEKGKMPVEPGKYTPFRGLSNCQQMIVLNGDLPQITSASCRTQMDIQK